MSIQEILTQVQSGALSLSAAEALLRENPAERSYEEMGFAKLDTDRKKRSGFAEVIYCQGKSDEFIGQIFRKLYEVEGEVFGTRASPHQYEIVKRFLPEISYDPVSHILKLEKEKDHIGCVAICTGGTADISVAEEAAQTAEYFGTHVERVYDVGVSGIHRILSKEAIVRRANCVIAVAGKMFHIVAEAESLAHHMPLEEVHFHEVGAIDSIVDIIAAAVTFDSLGITDVIIPCLTEGTGTVRCQHGVLPVPVPATMNIIEAYDIPLTIMEAKGEYVTPTGAAIAAAICTTHQLPKAFRIVRMGLGAGKRAYTERTNILRAYLIEGNAMEEGKDEIVKLETDIDDSTGEALGYTIDRLMQAGALDVHYSPVYMKKNRPAWELTVICKKSRMEEIEDIIFKETTTIGIREFPSVMRSILRRNQKRVETPFGIAEVKEVALPGERRFYPEYESVKAIAEKEHLPFAEVYHLVKALAERND